MRWKAWPWIRKLGFHSCTAASLWLKRVIAKDPLYLLILARKCLLMVSWPEMSSFSTGGRTGKGARMTITAAHSFCLSIELQCCTMPALFVHLSNFSKSQWVAWVMWMPSYLSCCALVLVLAPLSDGLAPPAELADIYVMSQPKREEPRKWSRYGGNQEWSKPKLSKSDYSKSSGPRTPAATISTATHMDKPPRLPSFDAIKGPCCFQCNEYGHIAKLCPMKLCLMAKVHLRDLERTPGSINGQRVKAWL